MVSADFVSVALERGASLQGVLFFSVGIYLRTFKHHNLSVVYIFGSFLGCVAIVCFALGVNWAVRAIGVIFCLCLAWYLTPKSVWPAWITSCSFAIYVMHIIILVYLNTLLKYIASDIHHVHAWISFVAASVVSMCVAIIIRKYWPRLNSLLYAGRNQ